MTTKISDAPPVTTQRNTYRLPNGCKTGIHFFRKGVQENLQQCRSAKMKDGRCRVQPIDKAFGVSDMRWVHGNPIHARYLTLGEIDFNVSKLGDSIAPATDTKAENVLFKTAVADIERKLIVDALAKTDGNRTKASALLQLPRRTLLRKIDSYGIIIQNQTGVYSLCPKRCDKMAQCY